jgi:hypothetical protein
MGSEGNEDVGELAKEAVECGSCDYRLLPKFLRRQLPTGVSATIQQIVDQDKRDNDK